MWELKRRFQSPTRELDRLDPAHHVVGYVSACSLVVFLWLAVKPMNCTG
jgi:hypothetical protein